MDLTVIFLDSASLDSAAPLCNNRDQVRVLHASSASAQGESLVPAIEKCLKLLGAKRRELGNDPNNY